MVCNAFISLPPREYNAPLFLFATTPFSLISGLARPLSLAVDIRLVDASGLRRARCCSSSPIARGSASAASCSWGGALIFDAVRHPCGIRRRSGAGRRAWRGRAAC
jgi:hypothetical protein